MFKKFNGFLGLCTCLLLASSSLAYAYDYPFTDRYVATVLGTPEEYAAELPAEIPVKVETIKMFPGREVPEVLWNFEEMRYSYIQQKCPAPLIFLVAGTGASFNSEKMQLMQKAFYQAGLHVVSLSSPTYPPFIVAASTSGVPGHLEQDSADLYRVMQAVWRKLQKKIEVTEFFLTGYSLGAAESAFIAKLDEQEKTFNFSKVLLINPPVSLYNSVLILDDMLEMNVPGGLDNFHTFYQNTIKTFAEVYKHGEDVDFNDQFLFRVYKQRKPKDESLEALIGMDFRISSENMVFTSDVFTEAGYVVPKGLKLGRHDKRDVYIKMLSRLSFLDYFRGLFQPYFQSKDPNLTEPELIRQMSLRYIEDYLRTSPKFGLIHNEDDVILLPGEIDYLRDLFGSRALIFPHGGHCGNMAYPDNVKAMVGFFQASTPN
jgi:pimeloyl-ACP methyl ester carboxylesterase